MRRTQGEFPFIRFSRRLLNVLWDRKGSARLSTAYPDFLGHQRPSAEPLQECPSALNLLRDWTGTYRSKSASCLYRLTDEAVGLLEPPLVEIIDARAG